MRLFKIQVNRLLVTIVFLGAASIIVFALCFAKSNKQIYNENTVIPPAIAVKEQERALPETAKIKIHKVITGDTLGSIANQYNIDVDTLKAANNGLSEAINIGDELTVLPQKGVLHTADMGDTLWTIANTYGVGVETIMAANGKNDDRLRIGEKIFVPGGKIPRSEALASRAAVNRLVWPTDGELSSDFGYRWGRLHAGIDIANDSGTAVQAARNGHVIFAGWNGSYGYTVKIDHGQGYMALYAHLSDYTVVPGQDVMLGQLIGYMGSTGNSTGPHLHFEVHKDGHLVNPLSLLP